MLLDAQGTLEMGEVSELITRHVPLPGRVPGSLGDTISVRLPSGVTSFVS